VFITRVDRDETKKVLNEQAGTKQNLTLDPKVFKTPKIKWQFSRSVQGQQMFFSVHCCQVLISKSTMEGMHRSLAKQDTLVADIISDFLHVNETPRSCCK
jgi:hypothetical protein